jgi:pimeloyl-ACP methyl ester carboxylesterase
LRKFLGFVNAAADVPRQILIGMLLSFLLFNSAIAQEQIELQPWQVIPPTPALPTPQHSGYAAINHIKIWYAEYGKGSPVILLHGGLVNSNYWGKLISALKAHYHVIVMDSRGHGRSSINDEPLTYHLMAKDVLGLMDYLHLQNAAIVGWSDGANIGLDIAMSHPERVTKLFALGGNSNPEGTQDVTQSPTFNAFSKRIAQEYLALSPTPSLENFNRLNQHIVKMWQSEPNFTTTMLQQITVPTWIVTGDHDEAIKRSHSEYMASTIPHAGLLIEPNAGHFAFLQYPEKFNHDVLYFLRQPY